MTEVYKTLAQGSAAASPQILYTVPAGKQAIVRRISLVQGGSTTSLRLWVGMQPTSAYFPLASGEWAEWEGSITLNATENVQLQGPSVSSQCDYVVSGVEITP